MRLLKLNLKNLPVLIMFRELNLLRLKKLKMRNLKE
jgi:hypothetical protein